MSGCSSSKESPSFVKSMFQTNGASMVRENISTLTKSLLQYSSKLNKRNPNNYSKYYNQSIQNDINNKTNNTILPLLSEKTNANYSDYLNIAFEKEYIKDRNDYLILGIYKLLYSTYEIEGKYKLTTMQYDLNKLQKANEVMQVVQYKIKTAKDAEGNFLYLTWQRKWQVNLLKKINKKDEAPEEMLKELLINNEDDEKQLMNSSNMSFQVITSNMIFTIQESIVSLGCEATNLSTGAIKSVLFFI
jgi:hypothetical protein